jgi:polar amino acid transport system substrate-binding protein
MIKSEEHQAVSKLEIGSFLVILFVGIYFGFYVYDESGFIEESTSVSIIQQQQNITESIHILSHISQTFESESSLDQLSSRKQIYTLVNKAVERVSVLKSPAKSLDEKNIHLLATTDSVLKDIKTWLSEGTELYPPDSAFVYELSTQRLHTSLKELRDEQLLINQEHLDIISSYHQQLGSFRGRILTLLLGTISLIVLVISLNMKHRQTQTKLAIERKLVSDAVNSLDEGVVITDNNDNCLVINDTLAKLCPKLNQKLQPGSPFEDAFARSINRCEMKLIDMQTHHLIEHNVVEDGTNKNETPREYLTESGVYLRITKRNTKNSGQIITFSDITYLKLTQKQLHQQATQDGLTGLANRNHFISKLEDAIVRCNRSGHKIALMVFDLDKFKQVNDTLGHAVGDELLISVANRIKENLREIDACARMGGDEFSAYLDQIKDVREVRITADRIIEQLHQRLEIDGIDVEVSSSIGIALYPDDAKDLNALMKHADSACYQAKQMGRNNYQVYNQDMKVRAMKQMTMESRLRRALKDNAFSLNYQPQMDLRDNKLIGLEAFIRWHDKKLGDVRPGHFIPLAEKTGLIAEIGEWVIREVCEQIRYWIDTGIAPIQVAINISAKQFRLQNLPKIIDKALSEFNIEPSMLALEITESVITEDLSTSVDTLKALSDRGLTLVIDDFGAGASSLYRLKELHIDALKIDQSFIKDLSVSQDAKQITGAIIAIAQKLHLKTIAEGVETVEQSILLKELGCDVIQGFLVQKPASPEALQHLLKSSNKPHAITHVA